jgi:hypothetical protein
VAAVAAGRQQAAQAVAMGRQVLPARLQRRQRPHIHGMQLNTNTTNSSSNK